jgi:hypothetical protein
MYSTGVRFVTGRVAARATLPAVVSLVADGRFDPGIVAQATVAWEEADNAWPQMAGKTVYARR